MSQYGRGCVRGCDRAPCADGRHAPSSSSAETSSLVILRLSSRNSYILVVLWLKQEFPVEGRQRQAFLSIYAMHMTLPAFSSLQPFL
eukprot:scaffold30649_cov67-Skeletonema_dohrnii-CCMP3373.AAC.1